MVISIYSHLCHCEFSSSFHILRHINSSLSYLLFTDYGIYWIHRWLHIPIFYKYIHKPHHKWISKRYVFISLQKILMRYSFQFRHLSARMLSTRSMAICNPFHITSSSSSSLSTEFFILPCSFS